jgi:hypothetical protein
VAVFGRRTSADPSSARRDPETKSPRDPQKLPWQAVAADVAVLVLLVLATTILITGGWAWRFGPLRLSLRSSSRPFLLVLLIVLVRYSLVPRAYLPPWVGLHDPLALEEHNLFASPGPRPWRRRIVTAAALVLGLSVLVLAMTWPQARDFYAVSDFGDPLFSIWRISWINHQLPIHPRDLFNANIFYPERLTLTYSDSLIVPALMIMPLLRLGVHAAVSYNILMLSGFVLSGMTTFYLVRALTARADAAIVAAVIFTLYPYRYEHYSHLELQMTMWMPLALWGLHRTLARGTLRDGLLTGLAFALQMLSSLYYGVFLSVYMFALGLVLWLGRGRPMRPLRSLCAGALVAGVLIAPVASQYIANKPMMGDRSVGAVKYYSAVGSDYLRAHPRSWTYSSWSVHGLPERQIFPRFTPLVLTAVALWPPLSIVRIGYTVALVLCVDGALGLNGGIYPWLYEWLPPFRGLRVPARFSILTGLTLAVLSGYGAARLFRRFPRRRMLLAAIMLGAVIVEAIPDISLVTVPRQPPGVYSSLAGRPPAVLAEFPMAGNDSESWVYDTRYMYFSLWHWNRLVNGNSGFFPPSYDELILREQDFPSDRAVGYLKKRGVDYVTVHGAFMASEDAYLATIATLDQRADFELVSSAHWQGRESRLYRLRRAP